MRRLASAWEAFWHEPDFWVLRWGLLAFVVAVLVQL